MQQSGSQATYDYISKHVGGSVILADYCPFLQQVSWSVNNDVVRDSKCSFEENKPEIQKNYVLEEYGQQSKCVLHNRAWQVHTDRCQYRKTVAKTVGCYNVILSLSISISRFINQFSFKSIFVIQIKA
jgi:hypothetical protein